MWIVTYIVLCYVFCIILNLDAFGSYDSIILDYLWCDFTSIFVMSCNLLLWNVTYGVAGPVRRRQCWISRAHSTQVSCIHLHLIDTYNPIYLLYNTLIWSTAPMLLIRCVDMIDIVTDIATTILYFYFTTTTL